VLLRELFLTESAVKVPKKLGRTFNHLEDLVFFHGSHGAKEALQHLKEFNTDVGATSIRMKWDGSPQVYWGRERVNGPLIFAGHNNWAQGIKTSSSKQLYDFIVNKSGNPKTAEELESRKAFAESFSSLYSTFDAATPKDFVGFVYGDILFSSPQQLDESGNYSFSPNPHTQTTYHVKPSSTLGKRIQSATAMVVGHAFFPRFGMLDEAQEPIKDFSKFNNNKQLIVQEPIYNQSKLSAKTDGLLEYIDANAGNIDTFLEGTTGLSDIKDIIYKFVNQTAKANQLENISRKMFFEWLKSSKVSKPKQEKISKLDEQYSALDPIFTLVKRIQTTKDNLIEQIESAHTADIWDTHGEGRVRYADESKQFGHIKLVPRKRWTPKDLTESVGICYGRWNPPHKGHKAAWEDASKCTHWYVGTNENTQDKKNPLPYDVKVKCMEMVYPKINGHIIPAKRVFEMATEVYNKHGKNVNLKIYTDEAWILKFLSEYNGVESEHGYYLFNSITQVPTQRLSSATSLREAVKSGDRKQFTEAAGISADTSININEKNVKFFDLVAKYLKA
jgi:nicotinamide mononucleotide adenylyltransferase